MRHMSLRGLPVKKASYTSLAAHVTLRIMTKLNGLCRPGNAEVWCTVGIPNDISRMRILASPATDVSATEDVDPCDGVDATTSMG